MKNNAVFRFVFLTLVACLLSSDSLTFAQEQKTDDADQWKQRLLTAERIMFLGDSNTHAGGYINQMEAVLLEHRAKSSDEFTSPQLINLGLSSETCCGCSEPIHPFPRPNVQERLERAFEKVKPDLVFACYGMNDGIYHPFDESRSKSFQSGIEKIIAASAKHKVPLVLLTPPPFDPQPMRKNGKLVKIDAEEFSWKNIYENYDSEVIEKYAQWMLTLNHPDCMVVDIHSPIKNFLEQERKSKPDLAFSNDGVHFDQAGHQLMAKTILEGFGLKDGLSKNDALLKLIRDCRKVAHLSWLSEVGHLRPGIKKGLPLSEANENLKAKRKTITESLKKNDDE